MVEDPEDIAIRNPQHNAPRFACFYNEDDGAQFFIYVVNKILTTTSSFTKALICWYIVHYVFNLEYPKQLMEVCLFFQECIFGLPIITAADKKVKSMNLATVTDIRKYIL